MVLSEYISETPEGIKKIIYHLGEELIEVEATIKEEKTIPKAHLVHERRRRNLKKHRHKCLTDFLSHKSDKNIVCFSSTFQRHCMCNDIRWVKFPFFNHVIDFRHQVDNRSLSHFNTYITSEEILEREIRCWSHINPNYHQRPKFLHSFTCRLNW